MKDLNEYIRESILDSDDEIEVSMESNVKDEITSFIRKHYDCGKLTISDKPNKDGKFVVDIDDAVEVKVSTYKKLTKLTNDKFVFGRVAGFDISYCRNLTTLEGGPVEVLTDYDLSGCTKLESLEGAPKTVGGVFYLECDNIKSLEYSPEVCKEYKIRHNKGLKDLTYITQNVQNIEIRNCDIKSLKGLPKKLNNFVCLYCNGIKDLKYMPTDCRFVRFVNNGKKFTKEEIEGCGQYSQIELS